MFKKSNELPTQGTQMDPTKWVLERNKLVKSLNAILPSKECHERCLTKEIWTSSETGIFCTQEFLLSLVEALILW